MVHGVGWPAIGSIFEVPEQIGERDDREVSAVVTVGDRALLPLAERAVLVDPQAPALEIDHREPQPLGLGLGENAGCHVRVRRPLLLLAAGAWSFSAWGHPYGVRLNQNNQTFSKPCSSHDKRVDLLFPQLRIAQRARSIDMTGAALHGLKWKSFSQMRADRMLQHRRSCLVPRDPRFDRELH